MNNFEQRPITESPHGDARKWAQDLIMFQLHQAHVMGANDKEPALIRELVERMNKGEIEPEEAVAEAREIFGNKVDYH